MSDRKVYGYFVVRNIGDGKEVDRIAVHYPEDSRMTEKVEAGLVQKVDLDRFYFGWEGVTS